MSAQFPYGPFEAAKFPLVPLGFVAEVTLGKMIQSSPEEGHREVPYIKAANVRDEEVLVDALGTMFANEDDIDRLNVSRGDIFVIEGGATAGRASPVLKNPPDDVIFQNSVHRIRAGEDADQDFLLFVLQCVPASGWYDALCNAATFKHLTSEKMASLLIPLPDLDSQRAIAGYLTSEVHHVQSLTFGVPTVGLREDGGSVARMVGHLRERRWALMMSYVTGQEQV